MSADDSNLTTQTVRHSCNLLNTLVEADAVGYGEDNLCLIMLVWHGVKVVKSWNFMIGRLLRLRPLLTEA